MSEQSEPATENDPVLYWAGLVMTKGSKLETQSQECFLDTTQTDGKDNMRLNMSLVDWLGKREE